MFAAEITADGSGATTTTAGQAGTYLTLLAWNATGQVTLGFTADPLGAHGIKRSTPSFLNTSGITSQWLCRLAFHISVTSNNADLLTFTFAVNGTPISQGISTTISAGSYSVASPVAHEVHANLSDGDLVTVKVTSQNSPGNIVKATGSMSVTEI